METSSKKSVYFFVAGSIKLVVNFYERIIHVHCKDIRKNVLDKSLKEDLREIKKNKEFSSKREEILSMIWNMEEEIMGKEN